LKLSLLRQFLLIKIRKENTLPSVVLRYRESQQQLTHRFRKKVISSKVLGEVRRRRWFISKTEQRREDKKKAIRRAKQRSRYGK
jgi:small subunit ribosomal protein S21